MNQGVPNSFDRVSADRWARLGQARIYFGHQSVGFNIIDGVQDLLRLRPSIGLRVEEMGAGPLPQGPAFLHGRLGANTQPESKFDDFAARIRGGVGAWASIAFLKLCYADIHAGSDVPRILDRYQTCLNELSREFPSVCFLRVTVPLTALPPWPKRLAKRLLGRSVREFDDNARRAEFNDSLRSLHRGDGLLFDLAKVEATRPDGAPERGGTAMCPEYTDDRGHLNERGRLVVASELLCTLAEVAS